MLWLILAVVGGVLAWKFLKGKGGSVTLPTVSGAPAQIDLHAALQMWEDAINRAAKQVELDTLARIKAHANIQARADEAAKVAEAVATPAPKVP